MQWETPGDMKSTISYIIHISQTPGDMKSTISYIIHISQLANLQSINCISGSGSIDGSSSLTYRIVTARTY